MVICLKISTFVVSTTTNRHVRNITYTLWFAWKYLPLWYQQQLFLLVVLSYSSCDLLENIYLCGINNNNMLFSCAISLVVICLKISTFVVSTTTDFFSLSVHSALWFAWKYLPLWYQQQLYDLDTYFIYCCDLLENIYLCGINNNETALIMTFCLVVICLKISTFVVSTTTWRIISIGFIKLWFAWKYLPLWYQQQLHYKYYP